MARIAQRFSKGTPPCPAYIELWQEASQLFSCELFVASHLVAGEIERLREGKVGNTAPQKDKKGSHS